MSSNSEIVLPYTDMRNYVSSQSSISPSHFFHESSTDVRKMFTIVTNPTDDFATATSEPIPFLGCVKETPDLNTITEYAVTVGKHRIHNEPVNEKSTNVVTLKYL